MAKLRKITEGLTGDVCADIIYENDSLLETMIAESDLQEVTEKGNTSTLPIIVKEGEYEASLDKDSITFTKEGITQLKIDIKNKIAEGSDEITHILNQWLGTKVDDTLQSDSAVNALSASRGKELEERKSDKFYHSEYTNLSDIKIDDDLSGKELIFDTSKEPSTPSTDSSITLSGGITLVNSVEKKAYYVEVEGSPLTIFNYENSKWELTSYILPTDAGEVTELDNITAEAFTLTQVSLDGEVTEDVETNYNAIQDINKKIETIALTPPNLQQVMEEGSVTDKTITAPSISSDKEDSYNYSLDKYGLKVKGNYVNSNYGTAGIRIDPVDGGYIIITGNTPKGLSMFFPSENNGGIMQLNNGFIKFSNDANSSQLSNSEFIFRNDALKLSQTGVNMSDDMKKSFQEVLGLSDTGWIDVEFQNGTKNNGGNFTPVQYRKIGNRVFVQGMISGGENQTNNTNYTLFNLPVNFRPKNRHIFNTIIAGGELGRIDLLSNGNVVGVTYKAEWTSLEFSFFVD